MTAYWIKQADAVDVMWQNKKRMEEYGITRVMY